ncbi:MAG: Gfo/Idh/MocA family protein [Flexilinea sp.]
MRKLRFGILSCAGIARKQFIPAAAIAGNAEVTAVGSRELEKSKIYAKENGIKISYGSYEELLTSSEIDAVYIPLPNSLHKEWAVKAAKAGKHVLCEKPLALTPEDCLEMGKAAKDNGICLMEAFMYRFHPLTEKIITEVQSGILGESVTMQSSHSFLLTDQTNIRLSSELAGGSLMDVGCYCVNVTRTLFNEEPEAVSAIAHYHRHGVDDQMNILAKFKSGRSAVLSSGLVSNYPSGYLISGSRGFIRAEYGFHLGVSHGKVTRNIDGIETILEDETNEYTRMIEHFAGGVLNQKPLRYSAEEASRNMAFICAALASAKKNGAWVNV